jgi:7,8-dihydropterin-6-yl-methyl-4-(beta-D-ribofuranosyl)aminobenzene 5'-phosphate synthase
MLGVVSGGTMNSFSVVIVVGFVLSSSGAEAADRIVNLYDAFGPPVPGVIHDFGFSAYVEYGDTKILFDAGTNADVLRTNADALGIDLAAVDFAVASHSHADHISGFDYLLQVNPDVRIYFPQDFFGGAAPLTFGIGGTDPGVVNELPDDMRYFGGGVEEVLLRSSGRFWNANIEYVKETTRIAEGVTLVSTTSPFLGTFSRYPNLGLQGEESDSDVNYIGLPELSLVLDSDKGNVVIVGCSHSTVEAIVRDSQQVTGQSAALVMGGYHLLPYTRQEVEGVAERLKHNLNVARVAPAHCTGHLAFQVLMEAFGEDFVRSGLGSEILF